MKVRFLFASLSYPNKTDSCQRLARHKSYQRAFTCTLFTMQSIKLYISQGSTSVPHREKPKIKKEKKCMFPIYHNSFSPATICPCSDTRLHKFVLPEKNHTKNLISENSVCVPK